MSDPTPIRKGLVTDARRTQLLVDLKAAYQKRVEGINAWREMQHRAEEEVGEVEMHDLFEVVRNSCGPIIDGVGRKLELLRVEAPDGSVMWEKGK